MKIYIQARGSYKTLLNLSTWAEQNEINNIKSEPNLCLIIKLSQSVCVFTIYM